MALYLPTAAKLAALDFGQVVPNFYSRTLPDDTTLHLRVAADHVAVSVGVKMGEPVPAPLKFYPATEAQFNRLLAMLGVPL